MALFHLYQPCWQAKLLALLYCGASASGYLPYSSGFRFFSFLTTSTVIGGGKIVVAVAFLASFLGFLASLRLKSRLPIITSQFRIVDLFSIN